MKEAVFSRFDRLMAAVTFAEENEFDAAKDFLLNKKEDGKDAVDSRLHHNHLMDHNKRQGQLLNNKQKQSLNILAVTGIISIGLYVALLSNQDYLNVNFSKGGIFAFLPIITAFIFSYFHGTFTGHFWTMLGVEASKKKREVK